MNNKKGNLEEVVKWILWAIVFVGLSFGVVYLIKRLTG